MNQDIWFQIFEYTLMGAFIVLGVTLIFLVGMFIFATAMYIFPAKQVKIDLRKIAETEIESRIYLDEYQFTIANAHWNEKIEEKEKQFKHLESQIRSKAAALKSLDSKLQTETSSKGKKGSKKKQESIQLESKVDDELNEDEVI
ncbi:Uncharacterised protein [Acholeplasma oculi]|uniref:Uncharacterized protein n=1 Tax=Acholeplasma oculi TaxID=35623 RepID=A0A061AHE5_9MOLU|nr:hypothetical protein [Acholeplasma oculi]CDR31041.1 hypothetical protein Aocu_09680 [Acholeplasma oculi]SKC36612.1 hypothetical protein SAMN02745122_0396 [Acholeplasma oculi]SUT90588.1 Uncharacterised protein [Acholeplasma oculi]